MNVYIIGRKVIIPTLSLPLLNKWETYQTKIIICCKNVWLCPEFDSDSNYSTTYARRSCF